MLKRVSLDDNPSELRIARLLSAPSRVAQEENHCVPLLDEFVVAESALGFVVDDVTIVSDTPHVMLVTPLLVPWTDYPFFNVGEVLEFFRQVFEVCFVEIQHRPNMRAARLMQFFAIGCTTYARTPVCASVNYLCHFFYPSTSLIYIASDIKVDNILMDGKLFSEPWHPMQTSWRRNLDKRVKMYTRTERPPRYFLADFGNAGYFPVNPSAPLKEPTLVEAVWGGQRAVPEFKSMAQGGDPVLHDPFATDIFYLGCLIVIFTVGLFSF